MIRARVYRSAKREFDCKLLESNEIVTAISFGKFLKKNETIVVGDYVGLEKSPDSGEYYIASRETRQNEISRIFVREGKKKVTAANCDLMVIVVSVSKPEFKRGLIDRFLVRAYQWGVHPILVLNKMDEFDETLFDIKFEQDRLLELGIECFEISAKFHDYKKRFLNSGISELKEKLKGKTAILVGQSGVGKSKTIISLSCGKVDLRTKQVGKTGKGLHTTTWSEIIDCDEFYLIDSPGIRSFSLEDLTGEEDLMSYFPDIADIAINCKFSNCNHDKNSKGCAFWSENTDEYQKKLILSRLESYRKIYSEISSIKIWNKKIK